MKKRAFTLIELLVVIAIIGILTGIVLISLGGARTKARDAKRNSDIRQILSAQEVYYSNNEEYLTHAGPDVPAIGDYLSAVDDPQASAGRHYIWQDNTTDLDCTDDNLDAPTGQWFCVYATLENKGECSSVAYFAVSQRGTKTVCDTAPTVSGDCACF